MKNDAPKIVLGFMMGSVILALGGSIFLPAMWAKIYVLITMSIFLIGLGLLVFIWADDGKRPNIEQDQPGDGIVERSTSSGEIFPIDRSPSDNGGAPRSKIQDDKLT